MKGCLDAMPGRPGYRARVWTLSLLCLMPHPADAAAVAGGEVSALPGPDSSVMAPGHGEQTTRTPTDGGADALSAEQWESETVHELMQRDSRQALQARPGHSVNGSGSAAGVVGGAPPLLAPRLVALYGVGQALMAEVQVGRQAYLYVRGQAYPAGHAGDRGVYQLRGMNGACVQLERGDDRHSLCLRMLLGEVRP